MIKTKVEVALKDKLLDAAERKVAKLQGELDVMRQAQQTVQTAQADQDEGGPSEQQGAPTIKCVVCLDGNETMYSTGCGHLVCVDCVPELIRTRGLSGREAERANVVLSLPVNTRHMLPVEAVIRCPMCRKEAVCHRLYMS